MNYESHADESRTMHNMKRDIKKLSECTESLEHFSEYLHRRLSTFHTATKSSLLASLTLNP